MIVEYDDFEVRYKAKESDQWKTVGIDELILNYADTRWIPVTERLPEDTGKYLVTVKNGNVYAGTYDKFSGTFQCAATAWMPLPEPYAHDER